jgi:hypothetical protein
MRHYTPVGIVECSRFHRNHRRDLGDEFVVESRSHQDWLRETCAVAVLRTGIFAEIRIWASDTWNLLKITLSRLRTAVHLPCNPSFHHWYGGMPSRSTPREPDVVALIFSSRVYSATSDLALSSGASAVQHCAENRIFIGSTYSLTYRKSSRSSADHLCSLETEHELVQ